MTPTLPIHLRQVAAGEIADSCRGTRRQSWDVPPGRATASPTIRALPGEQADERVPRAPGSRFGLASPGIGLHSPRRSESYKVFVTREDVRPFDRVQPRLPPADKSRVFSLSPSYKDSKGADNGGGTKVFHGPLELIARSGPPLWINARPGVLCVTLDDLP